MFYRMSVLVGQMSVLTVCLRVFLIDVWVCVHNKNIKHSQQIIDVCATCGCICVCCSAVFLTCFELVVKTI